MAESAGAWRKITHTHSSTPVRRKGSKKVWIETSKHFRSWGFCCLSLLYFFLGWRLPVVQLFHLFCFRFSFPVGSLGGAVGTTAH